jgi:hypothetical protein
VSGAPQALLGAHVPGASGGAVSAGAGVTTMPTATVDCEMVHGIATSLRWAPRLSVKTKAPLAGQACVVNEVSLGVKLA